ncbi:MAG TPA: SDR family oxidoreductase [Chloroflexota bacterium]|nr:SDR family oxidoreductase [Chloroflexota bacterium]
MRVVIFGASGRTGRRLVEQALARGHEVTAFVRDPAKLALTHDRLRVVRGDVSDGERVAEAIAGQDAVLCALGARGPAFDAMTVGARQIVAAMRDLGVRRLITLTGAGVHDARDRPGVIGRVMVFLLKTLQPRVLADAERHCEQVRASGLDWTIVRVPRLTDGRGTGRVRAGWAGVNTGPTISRADAAGFMLDQLDGGAYVRQAPMISN